MYFPTIHSLPEAPRLGPQLDVEDNLSNIPELVLDSESESDSELPSRQESRMEVPYNRHAKTIKAGDILFGPNGRKIADKKVRFSDEVTTFTYEADDEEDYDSDPVERYLETFVRNERYPQPQHQTHSQPAWDPTGWTNLGIPIPLDFYSGVMRFGSRNSSRAGKRGRSFNASGFGSSSFARSSNSKAHVRYVLRTGVLRDHLLTESFK